MCQSVASREGSEVIMTLIVLTLVITIVSVLWMLWMYDKMNQKLNASIDLIINSMQRLDALDGQRTTYDDNE